MLDISRCFPFTFHPHPEDYALFKNSVIEILKTHEFFSKSLIIEEKNSHLHGIILLSDKGAALKFDTLRRKFKEIFPKLTHPSNKAWHYPCSFNNENKFIRWLEYITKGDDDEDEHIVYIHIDDDIADYFNINLHRIRELRERRNRNTVAGVTVVSALKFARLMMDKISDIDFQIIYDETLSWTDQQWHENWYRKVKREIVWAVNEDGYVCNNQNMVISLFKQLIPLERKIRINSGANPSIPSDRA